MHDAHRAAHAFAVSENESLVATAEKYGSSINVWDVETGRRKPAIKVVGRIFSLAFADRGRLLVADDSLNGVEVYERLKGKKRISQPIGYPPSAIAPDGRRVAVVDTAVAAGSHAAVRIVNLIDGKDVRKILRAVPRELSPIRRMMYTPDGRHLVLGNFNGTVYILRLTHPRF